MAADCCPSAKKPRFDWILYGSLSAIVLPFILYPLFPQYDVLYGFTYAVADLLRAMWWGLALGFVFVSFMGKIPKAYFTAVLGRGDRFNGVLRATLAGIFLDLCSHGIVLIGAKLYERGASLAQVMAFLIASPWNSLSQTFILIALIGFKWTLVYIIGSAVIAVFTGALYLALTRQGVFPDNPNRMPPPEGFSVRDDIKMRLSRFKPGISFFKEAFSSGVKDSRILVKWLLFGVAMAAAVRVFFPLEWFELWFGPTLLGLFITLGITTVIEVCSEGAAPMASDIVNRAGAPGNGFTFLMAGVATDYTEIVIIRAFSKSWKIALSLPVLTVPQIVLLGYVMNMGF